MKYKTGLISGLIFFGLFYFYRLYLETRLPEGFYLIGVSYPVMLGIFLFIGIQGTFFMNLLNKHDAKSGRTEHD